MQLLKTALLAILACAMVVLANPVASVGASLEVHNVVASELLARKNSFEASMEARDALKKLWPPICNIQGYPYALVRGIYEDIAYLNSAALQGFKCPVPAPRQCHRLVCSRDAAIFICNERSKLSNELCDYIAGMAKDASDWCEITINGERKTQGQEFEDRGYNVVVRGLEPWEGHC